MRAPGGKAPDSGSPAVSRGSLSSPAPARYEHKMLPATLKLRRATELAERAGGGGMKPCCEVEDEEEELASFSTNS